MVLVASEEMQTYLRNLENKAEEDANEAADIITGVNNKITDIYGSYKRSTKSTDVIQYGNRLDEIEFEASNKSVDKLVKKYIRKIIRFDWQKKNIDTEAFICC